MQTNLMAGKRVLITGARGQVGDQLLALLTGQCQLTATDLAPDPTIQGLRPVDLSKDRDLQDLLEDLRPDIIINPAAYTAVDKAESDIELCTAINAGVPATLGRYAARTGSLLVHYSTDYVFDGAGTHPRTEQAVTAPLNTYGRTKLDGENLIRNSGCRHLIFRTSWVFSHHGNNFVKTMLKLGAERTLLKVVADQVGAPTSARFLANHTLMAVESIVANKQTEERLGTYHLCCAGETSWFDFAREIFAQARAKGAKLAVDRVEPIASSEYQTPALRPLNSRLDCSKFDSSFGVQRQTWQQALAEVLGKLPLPH